MVKPPLKCSLSSKVDTQQSHKIGDITKSVSSIELTLRLDGWLG